MRQHATFHGSLHDGGDSRPGQASERADSLPGWAGLKQFDHECSHQGAHKAVTLCPRNRQFFNRAVGIFELGNSSLDEGLKLAGVQVPPLALRPAMNMRPLGGISGVRPDLNFLQNHLDHHTLVSQGKVNLLDRPRGLQSKKMLLQRSIFHDQAGNIETLDCPAARKNTVELVKNQNIQSPKSGTLCSQSCTKGLRNYKMNVALPK
jgi:hypothetical protein